MLAYFPDGVPVTAEQDFGVLDEVQQQHYYQLQQQQAAMDAEQHNMDQLQMQNNGSMPVD